MIHNRPHGTGGTVADRAHTCGLFAYHQYLSVLGYRNDSSSVLLS